MQNSQRNNSFTEGEENIFFCLQTLFSSVNDKRYVENISKVLENSRDLTIDDLRIIRSFKKLFENMLKNEILLKGDCIFNSNSKTLAHELLGCFHLPTIIEEFEKIISRLELIIYETDLSFVSMIKKSNESTEKDLEKF